MSFIDDIPFPAYVKDIYDDCYIIKFFNEKWQRDYFLAGKLYMRTQTDFNKDEIGEGKSDFTEGADTIVIPLNEQTYPITRFVPDNDGNYYAITVDYTMKPDGYVPSLFIHFPTESQNRKLFCLYSLWLNKETGILGEIDSRMINNFGEFCVLIKDFPSFLRRLEAAGYDNPTIKTMNCGFVEYTLESDERNVSKGNPYKKSDKLFGYQKEFRICAETDNAEVLELDLGRTLCDIAIPFNGKTFISTARYDDGKGLFFEDEREG